MRGISDCTVTDLLRPHHHAKRPAAVGRLVCHELKGADVPRGRLKIEEANHRRLHHFAVLFVIEAVLHSQFAFDPRACLAIVNGNDRCLQRLALKPVLRHVVVFGRRIKMGE